MTALLKSNAFWAVVAIGVVLLGAALWVGTGSFEVFLLSLLAPATGPSAAGHFQKKAEVEQNNLRAQKERGEKIAHLEEQELQRKLVAVSTQPLPPEPSTGPSPEFVELSRAVTGLKDGEPS